MNADKPHVNFEKALKKLELFVAEPITNERDMAGIIQAFEYTFEQFWKMCQKLAHNEGMQVKSPKQALEAALQLGVIKAPDEDQWLLMLEDRNLTSHTYNEKTAAAVGGRICASYSKLFRRALDSIVSN